MTCRVETRGGASTTPYTLEQEEEAAGILAEQKARKEKEVVKQAKKLAMLQEQAAKKKRLEEELERLKEEEEKLKAEEEKEEEEEKKVEEEVPLIRRSIRERGETSGTKKEDSWLEKKVSEWVANLSLGEEEGGGNVVRFEGIGRFCTGAIEGAKLAAPREEEARPRREPVKVKFPDSYSGKEEENIDNWEAHVNSCVHLQKISPDEHVLVAFHPLKDEAVSFARSLCRAAKCDNDMVAYSAITPLSEFFKLLRERFADVTRSVRASDKLQTIHSCQWRSARALEGVMDELVAVPDHGVTETQLVNLFYRAMPESLRRHFFEKSRESTMTYDTLSREVVFEAQSMPVSTFWHDLDKGKKWKGRTISGQVKGKDHLILTLDEGGMEQVPYEQIEWGLEEEDSRNSQGRTYTVVVPEGRPQGRGGGQGQRGQASSGRGQGDQGVGGRGGRQAGGVAKELKERMPAWAKMKKEAFRGGVGALIDNGATRSYISRKALQTLKLNPKVQKLEDPVVSILADNRTMRVEDYVEGVQVYFRLEKDGKVEKALHSLTLLIEDSLPFDMVLGMD
ncbi:hypothetical protein CBR_g45643 [Chara braunii]|uniref:Uncharacterized protein n=1 Tax=Chara braunii TaxID=69332 RepID=A0A388K3I2_CHABU|nr:hypothetical protein CBR_g45643 [Chara braunii]|eukprot:GBG64586.1 hypothetical protein CBR_g45643 [Chara braunii]